ncbi:unnamed protein product [Pleuronectes platessa]|uniref:Uncharacterized protein n=1 Tax=Pleuronectes platessa TaxID=8262 RepID=A0A9N7VHC4_PLEPL|nr:unnamed protein product [Pleuronectes platessa]
MPCQHLLERNITVVGTVQKNKPKGRAVFSSVFAFTPAATLVSYVPKKKNRNVPAAAGAPGDERGGLDNDERVEADMFHSLLKTMRVYPVLRFLVAKRLASLVTILPHNASLLMEPLR